MTTLGAKVLGDGVLSLLASVVEGYKGKGKSRMDFCCFGLQRFSVLSTSLL